MSLSPTLLINQYCISDALAGLLRPSNRRGVFIARSTGFLELNGARAIFSATNHLDSSATRGMLHIAVGSQERAGLLDLRAQATIADEFQPQLLEYRLRNCRKVEESKFDAPGLIPEMRELARALGSTLVDDDELAAEVVQLLAGQDQDARAATILLPEYAIIFCILSLVHGRKEKSVLVQDLAKLVNVVLRTNGEILEYSPSELGYSMRGMGLYTHRTGAGRALRLDRDLSRLAHDLARQYGIQLPPDGLEGCPDCDQRPHVANNRLLM